MATTVTRPNYWVLTLTSNTTPVFNFKFVVDVYIDGVQQARLKQPKNANNSAHFSFERIVKNYIEVTHKHANTITGATDYDSIHLMPQNVPEAAVGTFKDYIFSKNDGTLKEVTFKFSEEYASTSGGAISITSSTASDLKVVLINYADAWVDAMNFDVESFEFSLSVTVLGKFLTELPDATTKPNDTNGLVPHLTSLSDYKTFAWLNEYDDYFNTTSGFVVYKFYKQTPDSDFKNYVGRIECANESDFGSELPSSANTEDEFLIFAGVGGANVSNLKYESVGGYQMDSSIKYYTVRYGGSAMVSSPRSPDEIKAGDKIYISNAGSTDWVAIGSPDNNAGTTFYATGTGTGSGTGSLRDPKVISKRYLFEVASDDNCNSTRFDEYTLAWKNKYGVWDYYLFDGEHSEKDSYKREVKQNRLAGSWNAAAFELNSYERGKVQTVTGTKQITINTRNISDDYNDFFKGLLMSNEVILLNPIDVGDDATKSVPIPVNIKNTSLEYKTNLKDKLVQYSFTIEMAHDLKRRI